MSFLAVGFLAGLLAIAGPIIIHLIHRQRYPERQFTTLRFFDLTIKNNTLQTRLIDRILLLLRVVALAALAIGLARPFLNLPIGDRRLSMVIILDNSPSMARVRDGKPLFDLARDQARKFIASLGPHDRADILVTSPGLEPQFTADQGDLHRQIDARAGRPTAFIVHGPGAQALSIPGMQRDAQILRAAVAKLGPQDQAALVGYDDAPSLAFDDDRDRLNRLLDRATVSSAPPTPGRCVEQAAAALNRSSDADRVVVVLSDLRQSAWIRGQSPGDAATQPSSTASDAGLSMRNIRCVVIPFEAASRTANLGIDSCEADEPEATLGQVITGTAVVRNYGPGVASASTLIITAGISGRDSEVKLPSIEPNTSLRVSFPIRVMSRERSMLCTARIKNATDPYGYDDSWHFQVGVRPPITALCVNGTSGSAADPTNRSGFFIVNALSPRSGSGAQTEAMVDPRECNVAELQNQQLFQYGVIVLAGVQTLDAQAREKLAHFVSDGGGLLIFPPHNANPDEYNGWNFLPARVVKANTDTLAFIRTVSDRSPAVDEFRDRAGASMSTLSASNWLLLEPTKDANILAVHADGSPALIERPIGRGKVIMAAEGAHLVDSDWPLRPAFVILVRSLVRYLGSPAVEIALAPERTAGQSAATLIPAELRQGTPSIFRVSNSAASLELGGLAFDRHGDNLLLPPANAPGHYLLTSAPGSVPGMATSVGVGASVMPISVNHSPTESDLAVVSGPKVPTLFPDATVISKTSLDEPAAIVANLYTGRDLWRYILILAFIVLVAEGLIAWRWASETS